MNFKYYEIMSHIIPGMTIYLVLPIGIKQANVDSVVYSMLIAYIIGFFNNTLASWLEGFYRIISGGSAIKYFLNGTGIWKVRFYNNQRIKELLKKSCDDPDATVNTLFSEAMRISNSVISERLENLNASYAFSRAFLTAILISGGIWIYFHPTNLFAYFTILTLIVVALLRNRQREGYYIREVLNIAYKELSSKQT